MTLFVGRSDAEALAPEFVLPQSVTVLAIYGADKVVQHLVLIKSYDSLEYTWGVVA